jgi:MFS transporter, UMF1 family
MAGTRDRFTKIEKSWITYDWANSSYATIIMAAIFPIYFGNVAKAAGVPGDVWWGYGTSIATLTVAVLAPFMGAIGDFRGMKKKLLTAFLAIGLVFTTTMALTDNLQLMLIGYILSYIGFSGSLLFYDSFLTDVTTADRMDKVSAWGYAMGYIGGSTVPFIISIGLILASDSLHIDVVLMTKLSVLLCVVWWGLFSIPILRNVRQTHFVEKPAGTLIINSLRNIRITLTEIVHNKAIFVFMLAYFFYIDGVNTVIHMATIYGSTLGLGRNGMILALLVTQIVAVPFSILFSKFARKIGTIRMISIAIIVYFVICTVGFYMGFSLEPSQNAYTARFDEVYSQAAVSAAPAGLPEADQKIYQEQLVRLQEDARGILADSTRANDFADLVKKASDAAPSKYASEAAAAAVRKSLDVIGGQVAAFLADKTASGDFTKALNRAAILFWVLAALVGTCQGGIQALSRSFFGKLVPVNRSNEYFGFFDIFGKFAAVMGPALYAFAAELTGRSSIGIISLMLLFIIGFVTIQAGRKHLRMAEEQATNAARISRPDGDK